MNSEHQHPTFERARNEEGFVLVGALLIILLLVLIGISATTSTNLELQIAVSERTHAETFYQTESGVETATFLLQENVSCPEGFFPGSLVDHWLGFNSVRVFGDALDFWRKDPPTQAQVLNFLNDFADPSTTADLTIQNPLAPAGLATKVLLGGSVQLLPGGAIQMAAGYVGMGKAAALESGGTSLLYQIYVHNLGDRNSEKALEIGWRQTGSLGECRDDLL